MAEGGGPPELQIQKKQISELVTKTLVKGNIWYLIDSNWFKQWKKYVGFDSWDAYNIGNSVFNPGPIDNSGLIKDGTVDHLKHHLVDDLDYTLVPQEAWDKLVEWYGITATQKPISRKVVEYGMFDKHCKVEVYLMELKLVENGTPDKYVTQHFSKADTIGTIENKMKLLFNISDDTETRVWNNKYNSNTYEHLSRMENTVQDTGFYQGQVLVIVQKNKNGSWPKPTSVSAVRPTSVSALSQQQQQLSTLLPKSQQIQGTHDTMADPKHSAPNELTICAICLMVMEDPKALPCLHSYCLNCLSKYAEGQQDKVTCPTCIQDFKIPSGGVSGFTTNFFINTLKDRCDTAKRLQAKDAIIPCSGCGQSDNKTEAYCTDCGGFICVECSKAHRRMLTLKNHTTVPFADLQAGKVDIRNLSKKQYCKEHEGQVLRFYCTKCDILVCHECTVIEHQASSHTLVSLKQITKEQRENIDELQKDCSNIKSQIYKAIEETDHCYKINKTKEGKAKADLRKVVDNIVADIQKRAKDLEEEITRAAANNKKRIDAQKDVLQLQQKRIDTTLQMASELTQTGSDTDLALVYSSLKSNLIQLKDMMVEVEPKGVLVQDIKFQPSHDTVADIQLGRLLSAKK